MSDEERTPQEIIERLRWHQQEPDVAYYAGDCLEEAADAIEDLIKERDDAETAAEVLASENRRLRMDLETAWNSATFHLKRSRGKDRDRLDWLDSQYGCALVNDDDGMWAVAGDGVQNIREGGPLETTFYIEPEQFRRSTREAIDAAMEENHDD